MVNDTDRILMDELTRRIDTLIAGPRRGGSAQLATDLDAIRRLAAANGFGAVAPVVHAIEAALARGERGPAVTSGLALLVDAVRCGGDVRGGATFAAAACSLRIAG